MESWSTISTSLLFTPRILPPPQDGQQADPPEEFSDADYWERPPACPRCRERYRPIQFDDRYVFVLPAQLVRGDVLRGESVAGGSPTFVVVGLPAGFGSPKALLERFFAAFRTRGRTQRSRRRCAICGRGRRLCRSLPGHRNLRRREASPFGRCGSQYS